MNPGKRNRVATLGIGRLTALAAAAALVASGCGGGGGGGAGTHVLGGAIQGQALHLTGTVTTPGGTAPYADGARDSARLSAPTAVTSDYAGNMYVADGCGIRKIDAAGNMTKFAGAFTFCGNVDGVGTNATMMPPMGMVRVGNYLYFTSMGHTVRRVSLDTAQVETVAGQAGSPGSANGTGTAASFKYPMGIAFDGTTLYIADAVNHLVRTLDTATNVVGTLAGTGSSGYVDATGTSAAFSTPYGVSMSVDGSTLFVADTGNNRIRKIRLSDKLVSTVSGNGVTSSVDGTSAGNSSFGYPQGIACDTSATCATLYVNDYLGHTLRSVDTGTGAATTIAGANGVPDAVDGTGTAARLFSPQGLFYDGTHLYVADNGSHTVRQVTLADAGVITWAGVAAWKNGTGAAASFFNNFGVTTDGANLYVADTSNQVIRKMVIATGKVTTLAGSGGHRGADEGAGSAARFSTPIGITTDGTRLFVADAQNHRIRQIDLATGMVSTLAGSTAGNDDGIGGRFMSPYGVTTDGTYVYVSDIDDNTIRRVTIADGNIVTIAGTHGTSGSTDADGTSATFNAPRGLTTDGHSLFVVDGGNYLVRRVTLDVKATVTTLAGNGTRASTDDAGTAAAFLDPDGITTDGTTLYVTENGKVRTVSISGAVVGSLAGISGFGWVDGSADVARFDAPRAITTDGHHLFISDSGNSVIRRIE